MLVKMLSSKFRSLSFCDIKETWWLSCPILFTYRQKSYVYQGDCGILAETTKIRSLFSSDSLFCPRGIFSCFGRVTGYRLVDCGWPKKKNERMKVNMSPSLVSQWRFLVLSLSFEKQLCLNLCSSQYCENISLLLNPVTDINHDFVKHLLFFLVYTSLFLFFLILPKKRLLPQEVEFEEHTFSSRKF